MTSSEYTKQAEKFLADTGTTFSIVFLYTRPYFNDDKEARDVYQFTLKNARGMYSAKFGDSVHNTERRLGFKDRYGIIAARNAKPSAYDVLECLTRYDPGTFADFCGEYGYDTDSIKAQETYFAVLEEWEGVRRLFTPEQLEQVQDIN